MSQFWKIILVAWVLFILSMLAIVAVIRWELGSWHIKYISAVRDYIPAKIKTEEILADDYSEAFPGGWCDGLTFRINDATLKGINEQGLSFLKTNSQNLHR